MNKNKKNKEKNTPKNECKVVVVTSGKGGVGKTTTSASIGLGLAMKGYKTVVIDFDVGLRNLDLIMGVERRVVYDFVDVITKQASLVQALIKHKTCADLYILAASQNKDKDILTNEAVGFVITELKSMGFDYIICDSPAGIEAGAKHAMYFCDEAIVVVNPEISSIRDADRIIGLLHSDTLKVKNNQEVKTRLLVTRFNESRVKKEEMLDIPDINDILKIPIIGIISESTDILLASNTGAPVVSLLDKGSIPAQEYFDAVGRLVGEDIPFSKQKKGFFNTMKSLILGG